MRDQNGESKAKDRLDFLFVLVGSAGDVLPGLTLADYLVRQGHRATVMSNGYFRDRVLARGVDFIENGPAEEYHRLTKHPDLWKPVKGTKVLFSDPKFPEFQENQFNMVKEWISLKKPGTFAVVASTLALGARFARDAETFPFASLHLSPSVFRSVTEPPTFNIGGLINWFHKRYPKVFRDFVDRFMLDPLFEQQLGGIRRNVGRAPIKGWFTHWFHSPDLVIAPFPDWFAKPSDLPEQTRLYPFLLCGNEEPLSRELQSYLDEGKPPIVITLGSAMAQATKAFEAVAKVGAKLNQRVIHLTQHPEQLGPLARKGKVVKWAPLGPLFQKSALVIHHGGIGTTAQAFASGTPQLIFPFAHDQPDNAERIKGQLWGDFHNPHWFRQTRLEKQISDLLTSETVGPRCRAIAKKSEWGTAEALIGSDLCNLATGSFR